MMEKVMFVCINKSFEKFSNGMVLVIRNTK